MASPLTADQVAFFEEKGYLILPPSSILKPEEVTQIQSWSRDIRAWPNEYGKWMQYDEILANGETGVCRTENFVNYHAGFDKLLRGREDGAILPMIEQLLNEKAYLFKEKINYKEAGGGAFDPHIDSSAYTHTGALVHLTALVAVDACTLENGCLEVVDGSHKMTIPLQPNKEITKAWEAAQTWTPVPLEPGSMLLFGSWLAHRSGPNKSQSTRHVIYATYNGESDGGDKHDEYYLGRRKLWPPTSERVAGEDYKEGALVFGFGSPMAGAKDAIRAQGIDV